MAGKEVVQRKFVRCPIKHREWGMSRTTAWRREKDDPRFPKRLKLSAGLFVYDERACEAYEAAIRGETSDASS